MRESIRRGARHARPRRSCWSSSSSSCSCRAGAATLIPAITIPVSLVGTFAFVKLLRLLDQHADPVRPHAGHRPRRRRRHRRHREHRALHRRARASSRAQAAREAMREVAGAVIAISLVLVAVFVPVAFFPGTTGAIYRQFALTIAFSVALSAFNALTLTPALSRAAAQAPRPGRKWAFFRGVDRGARRGSRRATAARCAGMLRHPVVVAAGVRRSASAPPRSLFRAVPTGFVPDEDQGYFIVVRAGPRGRVARLHRRRRRRAGRGDAAQGSPRSPTSSRWSASASAARGAEHGHRLRQPQAWDERKGTEHSVAAVVERLRGPLGGIAGAHGGRPSSRRRSRASATSAASSSSSRIARRHQLEDARPGDASDDRQRGNAAAGAARLFTALHRRRPAARRRGRSREGQGLGVPIEQIFDTLQVYMG